MTNRNHKNFRFQIGETVNAPDTMTITEIDDENKMLKCEKPDGRITWVFMVDVGSEL